MRPNLPGGEQKLERNIFMKYSNVLLVSGARLMDKACEFINETLNFQQEIE